MDQDLVSIITLNWNTPEVTSEFLQSVKEKCTYPNIELIVVDNASKQDPTEVFLSVYPKAVIIRNQENLGFAAGNNRGIQVAKGKYLLIVNNDTEFVAGFIEQMLEPFLRDPLVGAVSPKIKYFFDQERIQYAGFNPVNPYTGRTTAVGSKAIDNGQHNTPGYTFGAHGCAMMVSRELVKKVGMFPEKFFLYYEEWDWSARMLKAGYKIYYQPSAVILHKESMSVGKESTLKVYYQTRNRILFMRRNVGWFHLFLFTLFFLFLAIPKSTFRYIKEKKYAHLRAFYRGVGWNLRNGKGSVI